MRLTFKRLRRHAGLLAGVFAVTAVASALGVGISASIESAATDAIRTGLAERSGSDLAYRVVLRITGDPAEQDEAVRAAVRATFADVGADMAVDRMGVARLPARSATAEGGDRVAAVLTIPDVESRVRLTAGDWASAGEVLIQERAAALLGVGAGDTLLIQEQPFAVAGLWQPIDHLDPRWFGDPMIQEGFGQPEFGPIVLAEEDLARFEDLQPRARWTIVPDASGVSVGDLDRILADWRGIKADWRAVAVPGVGTLESSGGFTRTASVLGARIDGLRAIEPIALLLLGAITLVTLNELARLLAAGRAEEAKLLWSRGASRPSLARNAAAEGALVGIPGAAVGAGAVIGIPPLLGGVLPAPGTAATLFPALVAAAAVAVLAVAAFRSAPSLTLGPARLRRPRRMAGLGAATLLAAAAGLSVWQLRLYGSPVTPSADGGTAVDPLTVVAPALALVAIVVLGVLLFTPVARRAERLGRGGSAPRMLAAHGVARRLRFVTAPIVVVALAAGSAVVAASYARTWSDSFEETTALRAGTDLSVRAGASGISTAAVDQVAALPDVDALAVVHQENLSLGSENGSVLATTPEAFAGLARIAGDAGAGEALADAMRTDVPGPELPEGTTVVAVTADAFGLLEPPTMTLQVGDVRGVLRPVPLGPAEVTSTRTLPDDTVVVTLRYTGALPDAITSIAAPARVLALDVAVGRDAVPSEVGGKFELVGVETGTGDQATTPARLDSYWIPENVGPGFVWPEPTPNGLGFFADTGGFSARLSPSFGGGYEDASVPPVVVTGLLAERFGLEVGDPIAFPLEDAFDRVTGIVSAITPVIPGADDSSAVLLDVGVVQHYQLRFALETPRAARLWIATDAAEQVIADARPLLPANTRMRTAEDRASEAALGAAATALWAGAIGCGGLAVIAVAAAVRVSSRDRRGDVPVLRALGLRARQQAAIRRAELSGVLGYGLLLGVVAGVTVVLMTVPPVARAAVPEPYGLVATEVAVDLPGALALLGALIAALGLVIAAAGAGVAAAARNARTEDRT